MTFDLGQIALQVTGTTSTLVSLFGPPVAELGVGGIVGWGLGRVLKAILKIMLYAGVIIGGIVGGCFLWLEHIGVLTGCSIDYSNLSNVATNGVTWGTTQLGGLVSFASTISFLGAGFAGGLALGLKR